MYHMGYPDTPSQGPYLPGIAKFRSKKKSTRVLQHVSNYYSWTKFSIRPSRDTAVNLAVSIAISFVTNCNSVYLILLLETALTAVYTRRQI